MKHLLAILLLAACSATAQGQIIKSLGFNTTNGNVVYAGTNNLNFTNYVYFDGDTSIGGSAGELRYGGQVRIELETGLISMALQWDDPTNAATTRTSLGLGATWLTNDNVTNFRTAIGLGSTNNVSFASVDAGVVQLNGGNNGALFFPDLDGATDIFGFDGGGGGPDQARARTNLGLPLPALTNTSNVTMMRALAGSTNTNEPFSGSISVVGTNNTNTLVFSNGILLSQ